MPTLKIAKGVAAQVQEETTALATRPDLTFMPAVLNTSDVWTSLLHRLSTKVVSIMPKAKAKPSPRTTLLNAQRRCNRYDISDNNREGSLKEGEEG